MKIAVTGGTGFVGRHLLRELLDAGHQVLCLARKGSEKKVEGWVKTGDEVEFFHADIREAGSLEAAPLSGCGAFIHLVGIIREIPRAGVTFEVIHAEGTGNCVSAASNAGIKRFLQMSALVTRGDAPSSYHKTKFKGEEIVRGSGLMFTIFQPTLILGEEGEFTLMVEEMLRRFVVPLIGRGDSIFQPVDVKDVVKGFRLALERDESVGKTYEVAGPEKMTFIDLLGMYEYFLGRRSLKVPVPVALLKTAARFLEKYDFFPLTTDQLLMFYEGSHSYESGTYYKELGFEPTFIEDTLQRIF